MHFEGDYDRDGAICVRQMFSAYEMKLAFEAINQVLASPSTLAKRVSPSHDGIFVEDFCNWKRIPVLQKLIRESSAAEVAGQLMSSKVVRFYHDHILARDAGTLQPTPWHQDIPYYNVCGSQNVSIWLPIEPVPKHSALKFISGSHKGPLYMPRSFLDGQAKWFPEGSLPEMPEFDNNDAFKILQWGLEPGDCIFFHMRTVHAAEGTKHTSRRRVLSLRYLGDDMRHKLRDWTTSPPFPGFDRELSDGCVMKHPLFPVLFDCQRK